MSDTPQTHISGKKNPTRTPEQHFPLQANSTSARLHVAFARAHDSGVYTCAYQLPTEDQPIFVEEQIEIKFIGG